MLKILKIKKKKKWLQIWRNVVHVENMVREEANKKWTIQQPRVSETIGSPRPPRLAYPLFVESNVLI